MATVRKIFVEGANGEKVPRWQLSYVDERGKQKRRNFTLKGAADRARVKIEAAKDAGRPTSADPDMTVLTVGRRWADAFEDLVKQGYRERSTLVRYRRHFELHIAPLPVAAIPVGRLTGPDVVELRDALQQRLSLAMARKVLTSFGQALGFARSKGWLSTMPEEGVSIVRVDRIAPDAEPEFRVPPKEQLRLLLAAAGKMEDGGFSAAAVSLLLFAGLRMSELRGLPRRALFLTAQPPHLKVLQRADEFQTIGAPKSRAGRRRIDLPPRAVAALKAWLPNAPAGEMMLVFPAEGGRPQSYANLWNRWWLPLMQGAGLWRFEHSGPETAGGEGHAFTPVRAAPLFTPHQLRHAAASLLIEAGWHRRPKKLQGFMGHATLQQTLDTYGHLFPDADGASTADELEAALRG